MTHDGPLHLRMSELSNRSGVAASTIRYYLRRGLLPEPIRTAKTMAYYGPEHLERLAWIRQELQGGASLRELLPAAATDVPARPHTPIERVRSRQRARLVEVAVELFVSQGYDTTTVETVVAHAGVGKAAFYRYFTCKAELLVACLQGEADRCASSLGVPGEPSLPRLLRRAHQVLHPDFQRLMALFSLLRQVAAADTADVGDALDRIRARVRAPLEEDLRAAEANGELAAADHRLQAELLLGATEYTLAYASLHPDRDAAELLEQAWRTVLRSPAHV